MIRIESAGMGYYGEEIPGIDEVEAETIENLIENGEAVILVGRLEDLCRIGIKADDVVIEGQ